MGTARSWLRLLRSRFIGGLALPLLLPLTFDADARGEGCCAPACGASCAACPTEPLHLGDALSIALNQQPNIAAARASLASAAAGRDALYNLRLIGRISREIPIRREQADLGVSAASIALDRTEVETIYAVTRLYYSVIYAREQQLVANGVVKNLETTLDTAKTAVKGGSRDVTTSSVDKITVYTRLAQTRQSEADRGLKRATAALREAIGFGPECKIRVAKDTLDIAAPTVDLNQIIDIALARRGEIAQASLLAQITCLEIDAQSSKWLAMKVPTFAAGADIHSQPVPVGSANGEYSPGALAPEMPTLLAGHRRDRAARASALYSRSTAVTDKTRNLIALDAEDAYYKWEEYAVRVNVTKEAAEKARTLADDTRKDFGAGQKVKPEDVLTNEVLAAQARAQYNEARYQLILALAGLERATGGGFKAGLVPGK
jgi:outer membrane protein TolC